VLPSGPSLSELQKASVLTATSIHPMFRAARVCNGSLAVVNRKMRQYSARSDNLLKVKARGSCPGGCRSASASRICCRLLGGRGAFPCG